jgi:hypothetical protein
MNSVSYKFGVVAMMAGLIGVPLGSGLAQRLRLISSTCDPLICAFGLITSAPSVYLGLVVAKYSTNWAFFFVFMAEVTLNMCWSIVADMLLVRNEGRRGAVANFNVDDKRKPKKWIMYAELFLTQSHRCRSKFLRCKRKCGTKQFKRQRKQFTNSKSIIFLAFHLSSALLQCQLVS